RYGAKQRRLLRLSDSTDTPQGAQRTRRIGREPAGKRSCFAEYRLSQYYIENNSIYIQYKQFYCLKTAAVVLFLLWNTRGEGLIWKKRLLRAAVSGVW